MNKAEQVKELQKAESIIDDVVQFRNGYYDERTDGWREGDAGDQYLIDTDAIQSVLEELQSAIGDLET